jgi:hypothetical protein
LVSEDTARVRILEQRVQDLSRREYDAEARIARLENLMSQVRQGFGGGGGGQGLALWCQGTGVSAATGSWPTLTPSTFTADIYRDVGGTLTLVTSGATVRWFYKDSSASGKLIAVVPNGDGTFDAISDSCTGV